MPTLTKTKPEKPVPVVLNGNGCAVRNVHSYRVPLPKSLKATITIEYGWFDRSTGRAPGWRARANWQCNNHYAGHSGPLTPTDHRSETKAAAIAAAVFDCLADFKREAARNGPGPERDNRERIAKALDKFHRDYTSAHGLTFAAEPVTSTAIAVRPAAVVTVEATGSERRKLTSDFEKAWLAFGRNFLVLGEAVLRAEEGGLSVDDLIATTGLTAARSTAYAAAKATRLWRVFEPFAKPASIMLDCESQFRDFPAELDLTPPEARKIVKLIEKEIEPDKRGQYRPTREQLKPIIAATVGLRGIGPEKRKPQPAAESHDQETPAEPPMETAGMFSRGVQPIATERLQIHGDPSAWREVLNTKPAPNDLASIGTPEDWREILAGPIPSDESDPEYWNGQPMHFAPQLRGVASIVRRLWNRHLGQHPGEIEFRESLATLLRSLALELQGLDHDSWHAGSQEQRDAIDATSRAKSGRRAR